MLTKLIQRLTAYENWVITSSEMTVVITEPKPLEERAPGEHTGLRARLRIIGEDLQLTLQYLHDARVVLEGTRGRAKQYWEPLDHNNVALKWQGNDPVTRRELMGLYHHILSQEADRVAALALQVLPDPKLDK